MTRYGILLILLLGFGLRLALAGTSLTLPVRADEREYTGIAKTILANPLGYQGTFRPPTYPYLLAFTYAAFGETRFPTDVVNALLATLNIAIVYATALTLFRRRATAFVTAFLFAISFELIAISRLYYSETLFLVLLSAGFWLVIKAVRIHDLRLAVVAGIIFALAALTRDVLTLFALGGVPIWLGLVLAKQWKDALRMYVCFTAGFALILVPWVIRNATIEHRLVLSSTSGEYVFAHDNAREEVHVGIKPVLEGAVLTTERDGSVTISYQRTILNEFRNTPPEQRGAYAFARGMAVIRHAPLQWLLIKEKRLRSFFESVPSTVPYLRLQTLPEAWGPAIETLVSALFIGVLAFAALGLVTAPDNAPKLLILAYILFNLLTFIVTHYQTRYRLPLVVLLYPYAAYGLVQLTDWLRAILGMVRAAERGRSMVSRS